MKAVALVREQKQKTGLSLKPVEIKRDVAYLASHDLETIGHRGLAGARFHCLRNTVADRSASFDRERTSGAFHRLCAGRPRLRAGLSQPHIACGRYRCGSSPRPRSASTADAGPACACDGCPGEVTGRYQRNLLGPVRVLPVPRQADSGRSLDLRIAPSERRYPPYSPARCEASKGPAGMSKHRNAGRKPDELRPTPRPPGASDVSDKEARDKNRRLKQNSEHGIHPVIPPRVLI